MKFNMECKKCKKECMESELTNGICADCLIENNKATVNTNSNTTGCLVAFILIGTICFFIWNGISSIFDDTTTNNNSLTQNNTAFEAEYNTSTYNTNIDNSVIIQNQNNSVQNNQTSSNASSTISNNTYNTTSSQIGYSTPSQPENTPSSSSVSNKSNSSTNSQKISTSETTISSNINNSEMVWIGNTGTKYHYEWCRTLKGKGHQITMKQALEEGRQPCKVCH